MKHTADSNRHPTEAVSDDALDGPMSATTATRLIARLGLTEREAHALLDAPVVTDEQAHEALHADIHALSSAFAAPTVRALSTDPKVEVPAQYSSMPVAAARLGVVASAIDKLTAVADAAHASTRVDAGLLQGYVYAVMPQLKSRARINLAVKETYSGLFAYHHARNPGRHPSHQVAAPATPVAPATR